MAIVARSFRGARDRVKTVIDPSLKSLTTQASKDECDLNVIVKKYLRTGELPGVRQVAYADISGIGNLQECLENVIKADEAFMSLPADVRKFFDNDPVKLVKFAGDDRNREKAAELGLIAPIPKPGVNLTSPASSSPPATGQVATPPVG